MDWLVKLLIMAGVSYGLAVYLDGIEFVSFKSAVSFIATECIYQADFGCSMYSYNFCYFWCFFTGYQWVCSFYFV